jgi:hypothetical protein
MRPIPGCSGDLPNGIRTTHSDRMAIIAIHCSGKSQNGLRKRRPLFAKFNWKKYDFKSNSASNAAMDFDLKELETDCAADFAGFESESKDVIILNTFFDIDAKSHPLASADYSLTAS